MAGQSSSTRSKSISQGPKNKHFGNNALPFAPQCSSLLPKPSARASGRLKQESKALLELRVGIEDDPALFVASPPAGA